LFNGLVYVLLETKKGCSTFWAKFSQTHLVTLPTIAGLAPGKIITATSLQTCNFAVIGSRNLNRVARFFLAHNTKDGKMYQMYCKMYKMVVKYPKCPENISTFSPSIQGPQKFSQIGIIGLKINHLAALVDESFFFWRRRRRRRRRRRCH
jgi:hypothetical protein